MKSLRLKKGTYKESTGSIYNQYITAGSIQSIEFCYRKNDADRTAVV